MTQNTSLIEVAPGRYEPPRGESPPEYVVAETVSTAEGLRLRPAGFGRLAKLGPELRDLLGVSSRGQIETVKRLGRAGFVGLYHASPGVYLLDVDSWFRHLDQVAEDPDFWDPEDSNWRRYMMANGLRVDT